MPANLTGSVLGAMAARLKPRDEMETENDALFARPGRTG